MQQTLLNSALNANSSEQKEVGTATSVMYASIGSITTAL
jgi:hypothetical protein